MYEPHVRVLVIIYHYISVDYRGRRVVYLFFQIPRVLDLFIPSNPPLYLNLHTDAVTDFIDYCLLFTEVT